MYSGIQEVTLEMEELYEEIDALRAILMNDVIIGVSGGEIRADMKLEGYTIALQFQGKIFFGI